MLLIPSTLYYRIRLNTALGPALKGTALLGLQSHFGDRPFEFQVFCPQNGTAVVKGTLAVLKNIRNKARKDLPNFEMAFMLRIMV